MFYVKDYDGITVTVDDTNDWQYVTITRKELFNRSEIIYGSAKHIAPKSCCERVPVRILNIGMGLGLNELHRLFDEIYRLSYQSNKDSKEKDIQYYSLLNKAICKLAECNIHTSITSPTGSKYEKIGYDYWENIYVDEPLSSVSVYNALWEDYITVKNRRRL